MGSLSLPLLVFLLQATWALPVPENVEIDVDAGKDQDIFDINEALGLDLFEGDIKIDEISERSSIIGEQYRWPLTVPYYFEDSLEINAKGLILKAFERYRLKTCIDYKPWEGEANYISVFKGSGCYSSIGNRRQGKQQLSIGANCDRIATIQHEFLHALGFWHEQSRSDRDDYVTIIWDNIQSGKEHNFNKYDDKQSSSLNVPYDYTSVMHYSKTAFKNGSDSTIVTRIPELIDVIGQRIDFSDYDLQKLNRLYNCTSSLSFMDTCSFELNNICGMVQSSNDTDDWQHVTQAPAGPYTDFTNMGRCNKAGYFMHFSTRTGSAGNKARLESRVLYPKRGFQCLQFYYYHNGDAGDELNIWIKEYSQSNPNGILRFVKTVQGNPVDYWQLYHVSLNETQKFRVVFEAIKGNGVSNGGISIDDINLAEELCPHHVWHIRNFTSLLNISPAGEKVYSPQYHSREGYAFQIGLYVNGTSASPFNLGIFAHLVSGPNDDNLQWPCPWKQITMELVDQNPDIQKRMINLRSITTDPTELLSTSTTTTATTSTTTQNSSNIYCSWTGWIDVNYPRFDPFTGGGDFETYEEIRKAGYEICAKPSNISCRAQKYPDISITDLGQTIECNVSTGLICKNTDQINKLCLNYEVNIYCCMTLSISTTTSTTGGKYVWGRPDIVGDLINGTYYRGPGKGTSAYITHDRLRSRDFIKGDDVYILVTMEDISHLLAQQPLPPVTTITSNSTIFSPITTTNITSNSTIVSPTSRPITGSPDLCENYCFNDGICTVENNQAVCRCPVGDDWWFTGRKCEKRGSTEDTVIIAVSSSVIIFVVMLIITIVSVCCLKKKYRKRSAENNGGFSISNVTAL